MAIQVPYGGSSFSIPQTGDTGWGPGLTAYLQALAQFSFQNPADFSNAVLALRQYLQTITPNAPTRLTIVPSGTSTTAAVELYTDSSLTHGPTLLLGTNGTTLSTLNSAHIGTGSGLPIQFQIDNNPIMTLTPSGRILMGTTTDDGVHALQIVGQISATGGIVGGTFSGNLSGGTAGSLVYQSAPSTTAFLAPGASGSILTSTGSNVAWTSPPSGINVPFVNARDYCTSQANTGGVNHGATMISGSNILTIAPGPFVFNSSMVGSNIAVTGAFGGVYTTIATYISPTQVTTTIVATATTTLGTCVVWNLGQDDTAGIAATLAAAGGGMAKAYFPTRVYVFDGEFANPAGLQGVIFDGQNSTFFISKTHVNTRTGGFLNVSNAPSDFTIGGFGVGATIIGPGAYTSQQIHCTDFTITNGSATATFDAGSAPIVGQIYRMAYARGNASLYNETYWKVTGTTATTWTGDPYYVDQKPALGTVSNVTVDGSGNLTILDSNPNRKAGYMLSFRGVTNATFLNGNQYAVTSINYTTPGNPKSGVVGYTFANTGLTSYASTADTGTSCFFKDVATITDTFMTLPDWCGIRVTSNVFPAGTNISIHLNIYGMSVMGFPTGIRLLTPNFGNSGELTTTGNLEGTTIEGLHASTGFFSNPSCYTIGEGCEFIGNAFVGLSIRDAGGFVVTMPGSNANGIGILLYNCNGTTINGGDNEVQTVQSIDPILFPGHNYEFRGCGGCLLNPTYISFTNSVNSIGVYIWSASNGVKYIGGRHFLAGGLVQPTNEFYISADSANCSVENPRLVNGNAWTNLSNTSFVIVSGNHWYGGGSGNTFNVYNPAPATSILNHNSPKFTISGTVWNSSTSASILDSYVFSSSVAAGPDGASTLNIAHTGSQGGSTLQYNNGVFQVGGGGNITMQQGNAATSSANFSSPTLILRGTYWDGTQTQYDNYQLTNTISAGTNPVSTLQLTKNGSTGSSNFAIASNIAVAMNSGVLNVTNSSGSSIVTINGTSLAQVAFKSSVNNQSYNIGYNEGSLIFNLFDSTANVSRLTIADTTGHINIPTSIASSSPTTGSLTINGGLGVSGQIVGGANLLLTNTVNPQMQFVDTTDTQTWNIGHNTSGHILNFFNATLGTSAMSINDTTNVVTVGTSLIVTSGLNVGGNLSVGGTGAFTGNVTAPTQATSDSSTKVATTAFVKAQSTASLATNGYFRDVNTGYTRQWGSFSASSGTQGSVVTFPIAFASACFNVQVVTTGGNTQNVNAWIARVLAGSLSTTGFTITSDDFGAGPATPTVTFYWSADGQ